MASVSIILLLFVQTTQILLQFPMINVLEIFGARVDISILYAACFFESFSQSLIVLGLGTRLPGNFTRNLRRVSEQDFLLFIYVL